MADLKPVPRWAWAMLPVALPIVIFVIGPFVLLMLLFILICVYPFRVICWANDWTVPEWMLEKGEEEEEEI